MKTYKIVFERRAEDDLDQLYDYIVDEAGLRRAGEYLGRIESACMALSMFPERGTRRDDLGAGFRTIGFERRATIVFSVDDSTVTIIRVFYGGQDVEGRLLAHDPDQPD